MARFTSHTEEKTLGITKGPIDEGLHPPVERSPLAVEEAMLIEPILM